MTETKKNVKEEIKEEVDTMEIEDGAILEVVDANEETITAKLPDGEVVEIDTNSIIKPECNDADHISRAKVLDVIQTTMEKYKGKVVLAMEEVRAIINAITTAVKE